MIADHVRCRHCARRLGEHRAEPQHSCPGPGKFPKWPSTVKDEEKAGALFDKRVRAYWSKRSTAFAEDS